MSNHDAYAEISPYYDLEFDAFDADIELYLGYAHLVGGPILELGSGTGRLLLPLAEAGFDVVGLDNSSSMNDIARQRLATRECHHRIRIEQADMRDLNAFDQNQFRLIIVAVNSFLHLESTEAQIRSLRQIRSVIDRDGLLVIDVFNPTPDTLARMDDRYGFDGSWNLESGQEVQRYSHRQLDSAAQLITTRLFYDLVESSGNVSRRTASYTMRYVHRFELELLLDSSGFELEGIYGSYALDPLEHDSDQIIVVAHRTANDGES